MSFVLVLAVGAGCGGGSSTPEPQHSSSVEPMSAEPAVKDPPNKKREFIKPPPNSEEALENTKFSEPHHHVNGIPVTRDGYVLEQLPPVEPGWVVKQPLRKP